MTAIEDTPNHVKETSCICGDGAGSVDCDTLSQRDSRMAQLERVGVADGTWGLVNRSRLYLMTDLSAASLGGEARMIGRRVRTVNEVAFQPMEGAAAGARRTSCGGGGAAKLWCSHYINCLSVGLVMIALRFAAPAWCMEGGDRGERRPTREREKDCRLPYRALSPKSLNSRGRLVPSDAGPFILKHPTDRTYHTP